MRVRVVLLLSLGLNIALGARLYFLYRSARPDRSPATTNVVQVALGTNAVRPRVVVRRQFFSWSEIESTDYPTYIANLRSIGCPESTIRDIIIADVNQLYARRRTAEVVTSDQQWWRSEPDLEVLQAAAEKSKALDDERRALLTKLLGPGWDVNANPSVEGSSAGIALNGPVLGQLPAAIKQAVQEISARSQQRQQAYIAAQQQAGQPVDQTELTRLRQQTRDELARVLSPVQLEEFLLRYSSTANQLRKELDGFDATPEEFRNIFRASDPIDQQMQLYYSGNDATSAKERQELEKQRQAAIKQALGTERYQVFQLLQDPVYRQTQTTVEQLGAPLETLMPIYQINQATAAERQRIKNDPTLTDDEREKELLQVQQDQQKSIRQLLAAKGQSASQPQASNVTPPMPPTPGEAQRP
ncbi:MAG: DUF1542 domain-containing protein [Candidatus Omnitrophica bacterium]|nr:DUF1542 domain-containing protein [Candidatus Omnitrophota bacterium]